MTSTFLLQGLLDTADFESVSVSSTLFQPITVPETGSHGHARHADAPHATSFAPSVPTLAKEPSTAGVFKAVSEVTGLVSQLYRTAENLSSLRTKYVEAITACAQYDHMNPAEAPCGKQTDLLELAEVKHLLGLSRGRLGRLWKRVVHKMEPAILAADAAALQLGATRMAAA